MNRSWLLVMAAAVFEVLWVAGLKHADTWGEWVFTAAAIAISFAGLIVSAKRLPAGTVYAVFVGLGTAGTVIAEMIWFGVPFQWTKLALIALLLTGVIGLKLVTKSSGDHQQRRELS